MDEEELRRSIDDIAHDRADMYTPPLDSPQVRTGVGRSSSSEAEASEASDVSTPLRPTASSARRQQSVSLWSALRTLVGQGDAPLLDGSSLALDERTRLELYSGTSNERSGRSVDAPRRRHTRGPDAWDKACAAARASFKKKVSASRAAAESPARLGDVAVEYHANVRGVLRDYVSAMDGHGMVYKCCFGGGPLGVKIALARYGDQGRRFVVVDHVSPSSEHFGTIKRTDELIAVNSKVIVEPTSVARLAELRAAIATAKRPLELTFIEGEDRDRADTPTRHFDDPSDVLAPGPDRGGPPKHRSHAPVHVLRVARQTTPYPLHHGARVRRPAALRPPGGAPARSPERRPGRPRAGPVETRREAPSAARRWLLFLVSCALLGAALLQTDAVPNRSSREPPPRAAGLARRVGPFEAAFAVGVAVAVFRAPQAARPVGAALRAAATSARTARALKVAPNAAARARSAKAARKVLKRLA